MMRNKQLSIYYLLIISAIIKISRSLKQCIRKVTSHESQSGSRKFNLREPLFCYGSHIL